MNKFALIVMTISFLVHVKLETARTAEPKLKLMATVVTGKSFVNTAIKVKCYLYHT